MPMIVDHFDLGSIEEVYADGCEEDIACKFYNSPNNTDEPVTERLIKKRKKKSILFQQEDTRQYTLVGLKLKFIDTDTENDHSSVKSVCSENGEHDLFIVSNDMVKFNYGIPRKFVSQNYKHTLSKNEFRKSVLNYLRDLV